MGTMNAVQASERCEARARGLTLVDVLAVVTIVAVLAAFLWPVARSVRERVYDAKCATKLRQFGVGLLQYRHDYDGDGVYGYPYAMGIPPSLGLLVDGGYLDDEAFRCSYAYPHGGFYTYAGGLGAEGEGRGEVYRRALGKYYAYFKEDGIVIADFNHNVQPSLSSPYLTRKAIGLFLGGHVRLVRKMGEPADWGFWHDQDEYSRFLSQYDSEGGQ